MSAANPHLNSLSSLFDDQLMRWQFVVLCAALALLSLLFNVDTSTIVIAGNYDNERYVDLARAILATGWLGEYDYLTLIRLPVYPLMLAFSSALEARLPFFQHSLLIVAFLLLVLALQQANVSRSRTLLILCACLFNPLTLFLPKAVLTETLAVVGLTLILAACIGCYTQLQKRGYRFFAWLCLLSVELGFYINIRTEGLWLFGLFALLLLGVFLRILVQGRENKTNNPSALALYLLVFLPIATSLLISEGFAAINQRVYGVNTTTEMSEENFTRAMKLLTRIEAQENRPRIPVSNASFAAAYPASPHFGELRWSIDAELEGGPWLQTGCDWMGECEQLSGGWTVWAIRDAAQKAGRHTSAWEASAYYKQVADELAAACEEGRLDCSNNTTGSALAPPIKIDYFPAIALASAHWLIDFVSFSGLTEILQGILTIPVSENLIQRYDEVTNDQHDITANSNSPIYPMWFAVYATMQVIVLLILFVALLINLRAWFNSEKRAPLIQLCHSIDRNIIGLFALGLLIGRAVVVGYVDVMSFAAQLRYMLVVYPALMVFLFVFLPSPQQLTPAKKAVD